jgi:hypothetical protein
MLICIPVYVSALPLSVGGGDMFGAELQSYSWDGVNLSGAFVNTGYYGFFDFCYGEISLNLAAGFGTVNYFTGAKFSVSIDAAGKYPFKINGITVYPLAGLNAGYDFAIGFNAKILMGMGLDYYFADKLFLRTEVAYSGTLVSQLFLEDRIFADQNGFDYSSSNNGFIIRVGVGYRFR